MTKWPDVITTELWPFALKLTVDIQNAMPTDSGLSPEEIFTGRKSRNRLEDFHTFGCPVFVLEAALQQGQKIAKWTPRSRMAVYLGHSPNHASTVPLVLNIRSGLVSPQYHGIYDDQFMMTSCLQTNALPPNWNELFKQRRKKSLDGKSALQEKHTLGSEWVEPQPVQQSERAKRVMFVDEVEE